jgi:1,4-alpha-glucan branching enzyme
MAIKKAGAFSLVLHAHLPYVLDHGRWPHGTDWLNEAAAETYVPLLNALNDLVAEGIPSKLTIGISPVLAEQLADERFIKGFIDYCGEKIEAAEKDEAQFRKHGRELMTELSVMWQKFYTEILDTFRNRYHGNIVSGFAELQNGDHIEIITCGATHGYLPLLSQDTSIQAQVKMAVRVHKRHFGRQPRGIWLPEAAYRPAYEWKPPVDSDVGQKAYKRKGIEEFLSENGIEFFIIDTAILKGGKSIGVYIDRFEALKQLWGQFEKEYKPREENLERTPHEVYLVGEHEGKRPVAVFTRDPDTGLQVWSGEHGYPGDGNYLDFHKKHFPGGHRYWKVTSSKADLADKMEYYPADALERMHSNADHFSDLITNILRGYHAEHNGTGILCAPYDAELFGHWWFEGPEFIKQVYRNLAKSEDVGVATLSEQLDHAKPTRVISIPEGSWGQGGYHYIWLNKWCEWTWKHIYNDELKMRNLARKYKGTDNQRFRDIVEQAARELFLLSASDWQFLISTWAARDYAELRLTRHHEDFTRLAEMADKVWNGGELDDSDRSYLHDCRERDDLFKDVDPGWYAEVEYPG